MNQKGNHISVLLVIAIIFSSCNKSSHDSDVEDSHCVTIYGEEERTEISTTYFSNNVKISSGRCRAPIAEEEVAMKKHLFKILRENWNSEFDAELIGDLEEQYYNNSKVSCIIQKDNPQLSDSLIVVSRIVYSFDENYAAQFVCGKKDSLFNGVVLIYPSLTDSLKFVPIGLSWINREMKTNVVIN